MLVQDTISIHTMLEELISEEGNLCVSMIIPAAGLPSEPVARKACAMQFASECYSQLRAGHPGKAEPLIECIDTFLQHTEFTASPFALGIYASIHVQHVINLPFTVAEKLVIGNRFGLRELLYARQLAMPYHLVLLDDKQILVLDGALDHLQLVMQRAFPPGVHNSLDRLPGNRTRTAGTSPMNTTFINHERECKDVVFQEIDRALDKHDPESSFIIVCGCKRVAAPFVNHTRHAGQITSVIYDNFTGIKYSELVTFLWPDIESCLEEKLQEELEQFEEMHGEGRALEGLKDVWPAVVEDLGETLLVERDYSTMGYLNKHFTQQLYLYPPPFPFITLPDAVEHLLEGALKKNLKLVLTNNDRLLRYGRIGLVTAI
jgi:hypothetical protein